MKMIDVKIEVAVRLLELGATLFHQNYRNSYYLKYDPSNMVCFIKDRIKK